MLYNETVFFLLADCNEILGQKTSYSNRVPVKDTIEVNMQIVIFFCVYSSIFHYQNVYQTNERNDEISEKSSSDHYPRQSDSIQANTFIFIFPLFYSGFEASPTTFWQKHKKHLRNSKLTCFRNICFQHYRPNQIDKNWWLHIISLRFSLLFWANFWEKGFLTSSSRISIKRARKFTLCVKEPDYYHKISRLIKPQSK